MFLKRVFQRDDSHEFRPILAEIEESPVSPLGRTTFWIIIAVIFFAIFWTIFGKVDIVISARGKVIPDGNIKIIQPLDTGVVSNILVKEGDYVKKGQPLMDIDPSTTEPQLESSEKNLNYIQMEISRLKATSGEGRFVATHSDSASADTQRDLYKASTSSLAEQVAAKRLEMNKINEQMNSARSEISHNNTLLTMSLEKEKRLSAVLDIIAKTQYEQTLNDITMYRSRIDEAKYKLEELAQQKMQIAEEIDFARSSFKTDNLKELSDREKQATELQSQIEQVAFRKAKQRIVSPVDGFVDYLFIHTVGGVVTPAQKLLSIVPNESPLVIQATVLNKDIGFVKVGQEVSIKVDTFDFQKYGLLKGKVRQISKDAREDQKLGPVYDIYVTPTKKTLLVEGKEETISSGMSVNSEIKVGKRRIIEFFIYPLIKYMNEGISVR